MSSLPAFSEKEENTLPPFSDPAPPVLAPDDLQETARRYSLALNGDYAAQGEYEGLINSGLEKMLREQVAIKEESTKLQAHTELVRSIAGLRDRTPQEEAILQEIIQSTANLKPEDRETILERKFGGALAAYAVSIGGNKETEEELSDPSGAGIDKVNYLTSHLALMAGMRKKAAEIKAERENKSYLSTAYEIGVNIIPGLESLNINLASDEDPWSLFAGEASKEISDMLLWMDDGEAALKKANEIIDNMRGISDWQAIALAEYIGGGSWSDRIFLNATTAFDLGTAGTGAVAKGALKNVTSLGKAAIVTTAQRNPTAARVLGNFGRTAQAAQSAAAAGVQRMRTNPARVAAAQGVNLRSSTDQNVLQDLRDSLPFTFQDPATDFMANYAGPYQHMASEIMNNQARNSENMISVLLDKTRASRATDAEYDEMLRRNIALIKEQGTLPGRELGQIVQNVPQPLGARYEPFLKEVAFEKPEENILDSGYLFIEYGNPITKDGFDTASDAAAYAEKGLRLSRMDWSIKQTGSKYFLQAKSPLVEQLDGTLRATKLDDAKLADNFSSIVLNKILSADTYLSKHDQGTTKVGMHLPAKVKAALDTTVQKILDAKESKQQFEEFTGFLEFQTKQERIIVDPVTGNQTKALGYWSPDMNTLAVDFADYTASRGARRTPTLKETEAYLNFRALQDMDWAFRATRLLQQQNAKGVKAFQFNNYNMSMKGRAVTKLPAATDKEFVVAHFERGGLRDLYSNRDVTGKGAGNYALHEAEIRRLIDEEGYKLIELAQPDIYPLAKKIDNGNPVTDERVDYVLIKDFKQRNLRLIEGDTLRKSEGGHHNWDTEEFIGQDAVHQTASGKHYLSGWKSLAGFKRSETKVSAEVLRDANHVRELMLRGDEAAARAYIASSRLPYNADDFIRNFKDAVDPVTGEITPAMWDVKVPFRAARKGTVAEQKDLDEVRRAYPGLRSSDDVQNNLWESIDKKFIGKRADELLDTVAEDAGKLVVRTAPMRSALDTINSAAHNMIRSHSIDNVKASAINKWISAYGHLLDAPIEDVRNNPAWYFHNGTMRTGDKKALQNAKVQRQAVLNILGTHSDVDNIFDIYRQKFSTLVENTLGYKMADTIDNIALMKTRDPFKFARSFAFHTKIGLFNPIQGFLQAQSVAHAMMITGSPVRSYKGLSAYTASRMAMTNPNQIPFAKSVVRKMGWDADDWEQSHQWLVKYGLNRIDGEHVIMDNHMEYQILQNGLSKTLDKGTVFFREGELIPRMTAWHIAWQEWRKTKPTGAPTRADLESIAKRQDDLTNNMTRKSSSDIQHGWTSTATQFWSWQLRLTENILGNRLSRAERARLLIGYSAMYGIPGATAAAVGLPTAVIGAVAGQLGVDAGPLGSTDHYADIKKYAMENGIDVDTGVIEVMMEGFVSKGIEGLTGKDNNFAQRMGPGGLFLWEALADKEAGIMDLLGGAALGIGYDAYKSMAPLTDSIIRMAGFDQKFNAKRTIDESIQALSVVSSVNNVRLAYDIMRYGEYRFRNGTLAENQLDMMDAALVALTGLSPQQIPDAFLKQDMMTEAKGGKSQATPDVKDYMNDYRRIVAQAMKHHVRGDKEAAANYEKSASVIAEMIQTLYPDQAWKLGSAFTEKSMVEQIGERFTNYKRSKGLE